ncbi:MAG: cysteine hydrolase family protein [Anaerolineae bacterium]
MAGKHQSYSDCELHLTIRCQAPRTTGRTGWQVSEQQVTWHAAETAVIVVDVWDKHWSWGANERCAVLAPRINVVVNAARQRGVQIIHAPSDVVDFYKDDPARQWVLKLPKMEPPQPLEHTDPPLPIDDSDQGSDTGEASWYKAWSRQHPAIEIKPEDAISADGQEVYNILAHKGIKNIIVMGVHTNMCVLNRPFAIKRLVRWGFNVVLARDLTDSMYNPLMRPYVSHEEGTQLVIGYIEKFWCPTITSDDLTSVRSDSQVAPVAHKE